MDIGSKLKDLFVEKFVEDRGVFIISDTSTLESQSQTNNIFSDKWMRYSKEDWEKQERLFEFQRQWYLKLYDFSSEDELKNYLEKQSVVIDAGCGLGYKSRWFADLSPNTLVIGMDYSEAAFVAAEKYRNTSNLAFVYGDIANTKIKDDVISFISCDQVIHHTEDPKKTMVELARILKKGNELAVYVYAKKALPRELLDEHFREFTKRISKEDMWEMSEQLTELGKRLSQLDVSINVPSIPLLGISGGEMDIQRFIYWNFLKCFWNEDLGIETSISTNFDWFAPSNAQRYSKEEFMKMVRNAGLIERDFHSEEACHSGRFSKRFS